MIELLEILAWPITTLIIFFSAKDNFLSLLPNIKKLKAGPIEAEFENEIKQVINEHWELPKIESSPNASSQNDQFLEIAKINPRLSIIDAWQQIEFSLKKAALQRFGGYSPPPNVSSPISLIRDLAREDFLSKDDVTLLNELRGLRNQATHLEELGLSYDAAKNYIELAVRIQQKLNDLAQPNT